MKNNFRFIFPRLIGATIIVGIAALVITIVFKLLLGIVLIGGMVALIRKAVTNKRHQINGDYNGALSPVPFRSFSNNPWQEPVSIQGNIAMKQTIVPIN